LLKYANQNKNIKKLANKNAMLQQTF